MRRGESKTKGLKRGGRTRSVVTNVKTCAGRKGASSASLAEQLATRTRELNERVQQQAATTDVLKIISRSTIDLQKVFARRIGVPLNCPKPPRPWCEAPSE